MKIKNIQVAFLVLIVIIGGVYGFKALGIWSTESEKIPVKIQNGSSEGQYDPFDIRGSYTFEEVSTLFEIDMAWLASAFELGSIEEAASKQTKDLEAKYEGLEVEIGNESVQVFVAILKGVDIGDADAFLPVTAVQVIMENSGQLAPEILTYLESHQVDVDVDTDAASAVDSKTSAEATTETSSEPLINGNTTFSQVLDLGITKEQIEGIVGAEMPPTNQSVKAYCTEKNLAFSEIKNALSALIEP